MGPSGISSDGEMRLLVIAAVTCGAVGKRCGDNGPLYPASTWLEMLASLKAIPNAKPAYVGKALRRASPESLGKCRPDERARLAWANGGRPVK